MQNGINWPYACNFELINEIQKLAANNTVQSMDIDDLPSSDDRSDADEHHAEVAETRHIPLITTISTWISRNYLLSYNERLLK